MFKYFEYCRGLTTKSNMDPQGLHGAWLRSTALATQPMWTDRERETALTVDWRRKRCLTRKEKRRPIRHGCPWRAGVVRRKAVLT